MSAPRSVSLGAASRLALVALAAALIPFTVLVFHVIRYGVNIPFIDQWNIVPLFRKANGPGLDFSDLWAQHNEHRIVFPRLIMLGLARVSGWNIRLEMFSTLFLAFLLYCALAFLLRRSFPSLGLLGFLALAFVLALIVFSPAQWENWLWGWQVQWLLNVLAMSLAVVTLAAWPADKPALLALVMSAAAALVGQFSLASGNLIWPACLIVVWARPALRRWWWLWALMGVVSAAAYFQGYVRPGHHPSVELSNLARRDSVLFTLFYLGRPFFWEPRAGVIAGAVLAAGFVGALARLLFFRPEQLETASAWMSIAVYVLGAAVITALGRAGFGWTAAWASRYTTLSLLFAVSTAALFSLAFVAHGGGHLLRWRVTMTLAWLLPAGLLLSNYPADLEAMKVWHAQRIKIKECLSVPRAREDPCLRLAHPRSEIVYEGAAYLRELGWGGVPRR